MTSAKLSLLDRLEQGPVICAEGYLFECERRGYLQAGREALLWKLDGLSEYDIRRPMVPTGTNLLGLIKHVASVELGYFGDTFGRPSGERLPWLEDDAEPNADMWATAEESREQITGLYRRAWAHSDATIGALVVLFIWNRLVASRVISDPGNR